MNHRYENPRFGHLHSSMYLAEIGRLRMLGRSEEALNHLERTLSDLGETPWVQGRLVQALLNHDDGRSLTAINSVKKLAETYPRHPHVRAVLHQLASSGKSNTSAFRAHEHHMDDRERHGLKQAWPLHNVAVPPVLDTPSPSDTPSKPMRGPFSSGTGRQPGFGKKSSQPTTG